MAEAARRHVVTGRTGLGYGVAMAAIVTATGIFGYFVRACWPFTTDDTFIFLRYADNWVRGVGLTWNAGQPPIEGYTSVLWVTVLAVPHLLGVDPVACAKVLGVVCTALTFATTYWLAWRLAATSHRLHAILAGAFALVSVASFGPLAIHAVSGMETALFMLGLNAFICAMVVAVEKPTAGRCFLLALTALVVGLARPEGNLLAALGLLGAATRMNGHRTRLATAVIAGYLLPGTTYFLWRWNHYGYLFPLTFYVKVGTETLNGWSEVRQFLVFVGGSLAPLLVIGLSRAWRGAAAALAGILSLLVFYLFPMHLMGYSWRYLCPTVPMFVVVAGCGVAAMLDRLAPRPVPAILVTAVITVLAAGALSRHFRSHVAFALLMHDALERAHVPLGKKLRTLGPDDHVLSIGDAGAVPYYSRWRVIDTIGLNNPQIALTGVRSPEPVLEQHPDLVVLASRSTTKFGSFLPWENAMYHATRAAGMVRLGTLGPEHYNLWLMAWPGSDVARALSAWDKLEHSGGPESSVAPQ